MGGGEEGREGGGALPDFFFFFPCSADHERDCPPWKVFFGLATNTLNVRSNNNFPPVWDTQKVQMRPDFCLNTNNIPACVRSFSIHQGCSW